MSTTYSTSNDPRNYTGILTAAITACIVALVAVVAVAGFAFGRHTTSAAPAPAPAHTTGTVTPAKPVTPTPAPSAAVETLQKQLGQLNYYEGPVDGLMGPQTIAAITYLQRDAGLPQTGTMNAATQAALANFLANGNNQMAS
jgi:peptidoglycan hydrolase-like protein with peptidoglycan-binding domain